MMTKKHFIILIVSILIIGVLAFVVGGTLAGWNILGWFTSSDAIWAYILIGIFIFLIISFIFYEWVGKR